MKELYFDWMSKSVCTDPSDIYHKEYGKLLAYLDSVPYRYVLDMDANRESDGVNLRYDFGWETGIPYSKVSAELDIYPCSTLEMLVALCRRIESNIMSDNDYGNRTYIWFSSMINNLGLGKMTDDKFDQEWVEECVNRFLDNQYGPNGEGGLVTLKGANYDLRTVEIWDQVMWWLNEYIEEEFA